MTHNKLNVHDKPCTIVDQTFYFMWFRLSLAVIYELLNYYRYIYLSVITNICYIIHTSYGKSLLFMNSLLKTKVKISHDLLICLARIFKTEVWWYYMNSMKWYWKNMFIVYWSDIVIPNYTNWSLLSEFWNTSLSEITLNVEYM